MARIYVAGPLFTPQDRAALEAVAQEIRRQEHVAVLPHQEVASTPITKAAEAQARAAQLARLVAGCDAMVALLDGVDVDSGTSLEIGYAVALNRPVLGLRSDARAGGEWGGLNLMVAGLIDETARVTDWTRASLERPLTGFLGGVRVFAGRLVRDDVPRLAKERGQSLAVARVDETQYPRAVKRRLAEVARTLEAADFGVEQEHVAELLELLEALIEARGYDRESLRAIKQGVWRRMGGYARGWVVDQEPKLS